MSNSNIQCLFTLEQFRQRTASPSSSPDAPHSNVYIVRPQAIWLEMKRFSKIETGGDSFLLQDTVRFHDPTYPPSFERIGRILEIRAFNQDHVFLRVFYMQPVKDVPALTPFSNSRGYDVPAVTEEEAGRELVATNKMTVINASAVRGRASVKQVKLEEGERVPESGYWWRWRFDVGNSETS